MEYVEGEPLSRMLLRGPLRPEEVSAMVRDLGDALDHAHAQGIVHRDVKPSNVLIREDGLTKLADLGIATASDGTKITRSGTVLGTAAYMAPEQLDGRVAGPAADVYALAAVSFEALSGKRPREGRTPMEIAHRIATEGAPDLRDVWPTAPKAAARALQHAMAREPKDRPASAGEFARELCEALEEPPLEKTRRTRRFRRRGGDAAAAAAGVAPMGAGGAAPAGAAAAAADTPAAATDTPPPADTPAPADTSAPAADAKPLSRRRPASPPASAPPAASRAPAAASAAPLRSGNGRGGAGTPGRATAGRPRPNVTAFVLAAIFIALAAATVFGAVLSGGDDESSSPSRADRAPAQEDPAPKKKQPERQAKKQPKQEQPAEQPAAAPAPAPEDQSSGTASYDPARGSALNDEAFVLMKQGDYAAAVPKLQEAVKLFPPESTDIHYAYTLFNLGKSLRSVGRPDEAIPYLEQRLRWKDQTATVQQELDLAR